MTFCLIFLSKFGIIINGAGITPRKQKTCSRRSRSFTWCYYKRPQIQSQISTHQMLYGDAKKEPIMKPPLCSSQWLAAKLRIAHRQKKNKSFAGCRKDIYADSIALLFTRTIVICSVVFLYNKNIKRKKTRAERIGAFFACVSTCSLYLHCHMYGTSKYHVAGKNS